MNKTLGTTLLVSGTMIGAGMLAMPLTSAGIGFTFTVVLLISLWLLLTYSALLFVEVYQTTESDSGIGTLSALYFGNAGRVVSTTVMFVFLYALLAAYISGGGEILMKATQSTGLLGQEGVIANTSPEMTLKIFIGIFTVFFGSFVIISTKVVDGFNRLLFFVMLAALVVVMFVMFPKASVQNLMAMPLDNALIISAFRRWSNIWKAMCAACALPSSPVLPLLWSVIFCGNFPRTAFCPKANLPKFLKKSRRFMV